MGATREIRAFIGKLKNGTIIVNRDVVHLGLRNTVDKVLSRLYKNGDIERIANGVYQITKGPTVKPPTLLEVATIKARAFKKQLYPHGIECAEKLNLVKSVTHSYVFAVVGASSSFLCNKNRVIFKSIAPRKAALPDTDAGRFTRALWSAKMEDLQSTPARRVLSRLMPPEQTELRRLKPFMPDWLMDAFVFLNQRDETHPFAVRSQDHQSFDNKDSLVKATGWR